MSTVPKRVARESSVESYLVRRVHAMRGRTVKLRMRGWPDRLVVLPHGVTAYIETKRPKGSKFEPLQQRIGSWLTRNGHVYAVAYTNEHVDVVLTLLLDKLRTRGRIGGTATR